MPGMELRCLNILVKHDKSKSFYEANLVLNVCVMYRLA